MGYLKAIVAGVVTFCGAAGTAAADHGISLAEWFGVIGATAAAVGAVYGVRNASSEKPADT